MLAAREQHQQVEADRREHRLRVLLSLDHRVGDRRVLLVGDADRERYEVARVVARRPDPELRRRRGLHTKICRDAGDREQPGRLAVARTDDQIEDLLVVGRGDDLVVEPAPADDRARSEARSWSEDAAAAGHREQDAREPDGSPNAATAPRRRAARKLVLHSRRRDSPYRPHGGGRLSSRATRDVARAADAHEALQRDREPVPVPWPRSRSGRGRSVTSRQRSRA